MIIEMSFKIFSNFPDAFDYCREANRPVIVSIWDKWGWGLYKLYPSGRADFIRAARPPNKLVQQGDQ